MECDTTYPTRPTNFKLTHYPISPAQDGQVFVCHQARLDGAGVAVLMGRTDQTSAAIQPRIIHPGSQFSATIGFQSG